MIELDSLDKINVTNIYKLKKILANCNIHLANPSLFFNFLLEQGYFNVNNIDENRRKLDSKE